MEPRIHTKHTKAEMAPHQQSAFTSAANGCAPLAHWGVIAARGADAASFVHAQLSQDFLLLAGDQARLAAYCSVKGRVLASFIGHKTGPEEVLLVCSADLLNATLKRLSMYVLRAKVQLSDASSEYSLWGLTGRALQELVQPQTPPHQWRVQTLTQCPLIGLPPALGQARALWITPRAAAMPTLPLLAPEIWAYLEVMSGVAFVHAPTQDQYLPQMLNYESVEGIHFKKGCYPGQEVVARSQFRGQVKRRVNLVQSPTPLAIGQEIQTRSTDVAPDDALQATPETIGTVVQASPVPQQSSWVGLACLQLSHVPHSPLWTSDQGKDSPLQILDLPYALRDDI